MNKLAAEIHEAAVKKGFWSVEDAEEKHLAKMISELGEVVQADRAGVMYEIEHEGAKPEGVVAEMADFVMMALDYAVQTEATSCFEYGWNKLDEHIEFDLKNRKDCNTVEEMVSLYASVPAYRFAIAASCSVGNARTPLSSAGKITENFGYDAHCMFVWCKGNGFDLWEVIRQKMEYNASNRGYLHGRAY